ncbi:hypothetical protein [Bacillus haynesii]|uniref:hypothetical protein n=1 Tax=Bacillus haynesii TaxID=1925021 RepID=UPI001F60F0EF|nr:hypothetical protein [Bacillus haynesii]MCI4128664.1 hypothetical protein [Bacillus haynesii]
MCHQITLFSIILNKIRCQSCVFPYRSAVIDLTEKHCQLIENKDEIKHACNLKNFSKRWRKMSKQVSEASKTLLEVLDEGRTFAVDPHHHALVHNPFVWEEEKDNEEN